MSNNIYLYDFNGSIQRNKLQDAIFKDLGQKDDFMKRLEEERYERHMQSKKKAAAIKIQSVYRSYRSRKRVHALLRAKFDESSRSNTCNTFQQLHIQIARLQFFFKPSVDVSRTLSLCSDAVNLAQQQAKGIGIGQMDGNRRVQLLRCVIGILAVIPKHISYVSALRFIELYTDVQNGGDKCGIPSVLLQQYFIAVIKLFVGNYELTQPLRIEDWLPPRADAVLRFLLIPIRRNKDRNEAISVLLQTLSVRSMQEFEAYTTCAIAPFLGRMVGGGDFTANLCDIIHALNATNYSSSSSVISDGQQIPLFAYNLTIIIVKSSSSPIERLSPNDRLELCALFADLVKHIPLATTSSNESERRRHRMEIDSDSDDEDDDDEDEHQPRPSSPILSTPQPPATLGFYVQHIVSLVKDLCSGEWLFMMEDGGDGDDETKSRDKDKNKDRNDVAIISSLCYFLHQTSQQLFTNLISQLIARRRQFMKHLWQHICTLQTRVAFGAQTTLLSRLEKGDSISGMEEHNLVAPLSLFIALFSNILQTVDDDDFAHGSSNRADAIVPFDLKQIASIATHFRELTLGLIDIAYPVSVTSNTFSTRNIQQLTPKSSKWSTLFRSVASLTKVLHERDSRLHFMPAQFWSNHTRQVVMNSVILRSASNIGRASRRRVVRQRPFEFMRLMLREQDTTDNSWEPPTAVELRNISIIRSIPFVVPFMHRVQMFNELIECDRGQHGADNFIRGGHHIVVHRSTLYEDAFSSLTPAKVPDMRGAIRVQMVNWVGLDEAGVDGGGIFREFLSELVQTALDPTRGFFTTTHDNLLYPNPLASSLYPSDFHDHFYFIGRIIAKLIYEGQLAEIRFADFFLSQWLGQSDNSLLDLEYVKSYDPLLHHNLKFLKSCSPQEVESLDLDFSVLIDNLGITEKVELKKNGCEIKVTADNRAEYIALYVNYFLSKRLQAMITSLRAGVRALIDPDWLRMFSSTELSILIGGIDSDIDFNDLRKFTTVHNIKSENDRLYADLFWTLINEFSESNKKKLLKFITGCSRPPLIGFKALTPPMGIQLVHEPEKLPTAATCMNLLKLPIYEDTETLRRKLLLAINSAAGFELS